MHGRSVSCFSLSLIAATAAISLQPAAAQTLKKPVCSATIWDPAAARVCPTPEIR